MPRYTKGKGRSITAHEREHFLKVAETHYAGLMFMTMLYCGLRSGEVIALQWKDLDFDKHNFDFGMILFVFMNAISKTIH